MATLQEQYNLIKEGKGDKQHFLKQAKYLFPEYITSLNDFDTTVHILKSKSLLSEAVGGIVTLKPSNTDWFKIFEAEVKAHNKQTEKELVDLETKNFDYKDKKNIDNVYGQSFLIGYLAEMGDPKNAKKTVEELKAIVAKNMDKDINYYAKNGMFGVKGIGLETSTEPKAPKGKHKSSGYGDLKEAKYSLIEMLGEEEIYEEDAIDEDAIDEGVMDDQIAAAEKIVAQKKKETADAEKKAADLKAKEASAEANS